MTESLPGYASVPTVDLLEDFCVSRVVKDLPTNLRRVQADTLEAAHLCRGMCVKVFRHLLMEVTKSMWSADLHERGSPKSLNVAIHGLVSLCSFPL